ARFKPNEAIALMGPTGVRTKVAAGEKLLVIGGSMAAIYLLSMSREWQEAGVEVIYLATFKTAEDIFSRSELEAVCSEIHWLSGEESLRDKLSQGFADLGAKLAAINTVWVIGSTQLLRSVQHLRAELALTEATEFKASVYGPMQCMLKGVCAQCLQWQIDPKTGQRTKAVYACSWHNQPLEIIDIDNLDERLKQNQMQEKLSELWLDYLES
ncbi:MAG TPA: pyridine nucleotide-disulfide oxidoreductase, partial [Coxiellaceae bacterium]|nr:pyridine nucleotide-disulfide oxidoreductase [Coxiellaceae bacterium]